MVRRHLGALRPRLEALGLEVTASQVRRPLATQLREALAAKSLGAPALLKLVAGASAKEARAALEQLVVEGSVREVVRASGTHLVLVSSNGADGDDDTLIPPDRIDELLRRLAEAQKLLKRAAAKKGTRARPWVHHDEVLGPFLAFTRPKPSASSPEAASLSHAIRARAEQSALPLRVPELLRSLGVDKESGKRALLEGASAGLFELEPESGMARLAPLDASGRPARHAALLGRRSAERGRRAVSTELSLQTQAFLADTFVDVAGLNAHVSSALEARIEEVSESARRGKRVTAKAFAILGAAGGGKTHIFARLRHDAGLEATLVLLRPFFGVSLAPRDVLATMIDQLCLPVRGGSLTRLDLLALHWLRDSDADADVCEAESFPSAALEALEALSSGERASRVDRAVADVLGQLPEAAPAAHLVRALLSLASGATGPREPPRSSSRCSSRPA